MPNDIHPALRAELDRELSTAVEFLLTRAATYDSLDLIEANVELTNDLRATCSPASLAAAAAALALHLHRARPAGGSHA